jgi:hypothetical protein
MYFGSREAITNNQLILGLGIEPEVGLSDNVNLEGATKDLPNARGDQLFKQNPERSSASLLTDTKATHTNPDSGHHNTLELEIYNDNNPSEYGPSPYILF